MKTAQEFVSAYFGPKCESYDEECVSCSAWNFLNLFEQDLLDKEQEI